jgi:hypothetical protein
LDPIQAKGSGSYHQSFCKDGDLLAVPPLEDQQYAVGAGSAALQCSEGKKATELGTVARQALATIDQNLLLTTDATVIFKATQDLCCNLLIHSVAYDILNRTLIVPVQEMKNCPRIECRQSHQNGTHYNFHREPTKPRLVVWHIL